ncbi:MAG: HD domain-containing protein [Sporomusaceae bacterium]|nr:HD domain-containing protein [Sporomusaceae bacterium]
MDQAFLAERTKAFHDYVAKFRSDDVDIQQHMDMKEFHTDKVAAHCRSLAQVLQLGAADQALSELIGLWHDVGRFSQYSRYKTFNDKLSVNHAELGLVELERLGWLALISEADTDIVRFAIGAHNAVKIPAAPTERHLLFAKIIRDGDKLDIFRVLEPFLAPPTEQGCSPQILQDLAVGKQTFFENMKTPDDRKLVRLSWVYDLNFDWTVQKVREKNYVDHILAYLPGTPELKAIREAMHAYMAKRAQR